MPYDAFFDAMPPEHLEFFKSLGVFCRTADGVCVHGGLDPQGGSIESQAREAIIWGTSTFVSDYAGPDIVLYGHWDNSELREDGLPAPAIGRAAIGIDTISHGVLTAFRLPDRRVFQSDPFLQPTV